MSLTKARKQWFNAGKAYYQREANSFHNKFMGYKWPPFERLDPVEQDYFMARAQQSEQDYGDTKSA